MASVATDILTEGPRALRSVIQHSESVAPVVKVSSTTRICLAGILCLTRKAPLMFLRR